MKTRINKFVAESTGLSRRQADKLIEEGKVLVNNQVAQLGQSINQNDLISFKGQVLKPLGAKTILLNKPVGYVCSRKGQGSKTIYALLPADYAGLKPVGRLDKLSSGLIILTNDGNLNFQLSHPKYSKNKVYEVELNKPLSQKDLSKITDQGVLLSDGISKFSIKTLSNNKLKITMQEGRNRQIRRTFEAIGYHVTTLHRLQVGPFRLGNLRIGQFQEVKK